MIRIFSHYVSRKLVFLVGLDALVLMLSAYVGISLHLYATVGALPSAEAALPPQAAAFALWVLVVMTSTGLYQLQPSESVRSVLGRLVTAVLFGFAVTFLVSYVLPSLHMGSDALVIAVIVALTGSILVRFAFFKWGNISAFKPRVLVLGTGSRVMKLAEFAQRNQNHVVVGYLALQPSKHFVPLPRVLPMEPGESLLSVVEKYRIDQIVIGVRDRRDGGLPLQQLLECRLRGVKITELTTFFEREYRQVLLESLNPSWMVLGEGFRQGFARAVVKRLFDLTASTVLLLLTLPIMFVTALCIFLESGLPVFYRQERSGESGRVFTLYKLRSMKHGAESDGTPRWAAANDDRTTRVGRIIRKLRIDELPQIINVFKGEMSFVGPRPERPFFVDQLVKQIPYYSLRHCVKPGITGWAQVRYTYGASLDDAIEKLQYDLYYVKNHRLFLDIMILIATVEVVLRGKGVR
jgi:sugar transferase (PEP-CTERM system associated)